MAGLLAGCAPGTSSIYKSTDWLLKSDNRVDGKALSTQLRYLRMTVNKERVALLVLGYAEPHPNGEIEVWFSAKGEVVKLQQGRVVGTAGLSTDWREVRFVGLPAKQFADFDYEYIRERDVMPGYRFGLRERVAVRRVPPQMQTLSTTHGDIQGDLLWFEETVAPNPDRLPPARIALRRHGSAYEAIYGEQCLAAELCFTWQKWPPAAGSARP
ncbi:MAG TPA: YjbF family lipoprotein [Rhodocyclaceae bacterium]|nr:YjbF family lipoprotein [Rhodocyclaceae bacterium]